MEFNYHLLGWNCTCGQTAKFVRVGTSSHYHLVGIWVCARCKKQMMALMPLEDLIRNLPEPPDIVTDQDLEWLKKAHITME